MENWAARVPPFRWFRGTLRASFIDRPLTAAATVPNPPALPLGGRRVPVV